MGATPYHIVMSDEVFEAQCSSEADLGLEVFGRDYFQEL